MSCGCNQFPCTCVPRCQSDCPEVIEKTSANINLAGIGVYEGESGDQFQFRGIRSTNGNIAVTLNNTFHTIDLEISNTTFQTTVTFINEATRGNTAPDFEGQVGVQLDTNVIYTATGLNAGDWVTTSLFILGATNTVVGVTSSVVLNGNSQISISSGDLTGVVSLQGVTVNLNASTLSTSNSAVVLVNNGDTLQCEGFLQLTSLTRLLIGALVPASSVICTTSTAGQLTSKIIGQFLSTDNQVAYAEPSGTISRATFDTTTVTTEQLAQRVYALIHDLKITVKPT